MTRQARLSDRLAAVVDALPLRPGMRVLEIGGAPGAAARAVARRIGGGHGSGSPPPSHPPGVCSSMVVTHSERWISAMQGTPERQT